MEISANDVRIFVLSMFYALVGVALLFFAYKLFDWLTPTDLNKAIFEEKNIAVAIAVGTFVIGVATIIAAAIHG
jgi:uncharacterized membrane protein YjfL (UPF0719 family)